LDFPIDDKEGALLMIGRVTERASRGKAGIGIEDGRKYLHWRLKAESLASDQAQGDGLVLVFGKFAAGEVLERRLRFFIGLWQADPTLNAVQPVAAGA
jgi:hypothetical protein